MLNDSPWLPLLFMIITVALVIGLAYWFTRYMIGGGKLGAFGVIQNNSPMQIMTQTRVGKEQCLAVVRTSERYFLVGITAQNISLLAELSKEDVAPWLQDEAQRKTEQAPSFKQAVLDSLQGKKKG